MCSYFKHIFVIQLSRPLTCDYEVERIFDCFLLCQILILFTNYSLTYAKAIHQKHKKKIFYTHISRNVGAPTSMIRKEVFSKLKRSYLTHTFMISDIGEGKIKLGPRMQRKMFYHLRYKPLLQCHTFYTLIYYFL